MSNECSYRVEHAGFGKWAVIDYSKNIVFVGTQQQVEDWLDFQENQTRIALERASPVLSD